MQFDSPLGTSAELISNPHFDPAAPYGEAQQAVLNDAAFDTAKATISAWPGYAPTPLRSLPGLAAEAGVAALHYKDEGSRFGLGSFKALGGAYAVLRLLVRTIEAKKGVAATVAQILAGDHDDVVRGITVCCATDGNHGRSVAWGARTFGCNCVIFIHATVSESRKEAIEAYGAEVRRCDGNYDDSVREADRTAQAEGWTVVSDTSYPGYTEIPKDVMQGYELMAAEAADALPEPPTHVFVQTGVGGMAAAIAAQMRRRYGARAPRVILADPDRSACWLESFRSGAPTPVHGDLDTLMAGLACGEVSLLAWEVLKPLACATVSVRDDEAVAMMRRLADPLPGDPVIVAGESAVAGLAALLSVAGHAPAREALGLDADSRVLVFGSEADTDPGLYAELVGRSADEVRAGA
ncbi:diaminopropionate ammonia-lyase [Salipiger mucosus]|uniref:Threonine dehydratase n=1 Tax=Salipiger mucosus DSM 16094 TaxID=1123237 RepID=S9Q9D2_9RHOB|nr:diaminopropionate ammonia-lyase [Salipiger mucosus]EPX76577.1 Threonine dehydratase [Salipiger mucosus DSM 16094]